MQSQITKQNTQASQNYLTLSKIFPKIKYIKLNTYMVEYIVINGEHRLLNIFLVYMFQNNHEFLAKYTTWIHTQI